MILDNELSEIWAKYNPVENGHSKLLLEQFIKNKESAQKQFIRAYYLLLIFIIIFIFIKSNIITEASIFSLKISSLKLIKWLVLPTISFSYYTGINSFIQYNYYRAAIFDYFNLYIPELDQKNLTPLIAGTSFFNFELVQVVKLNSNRLRYFLLFIISVLFFFPLAIIGKFILGLLYNLNEVDSIVEILSLLISTILIIRTLAIIYQYFKEARELGRKDRKEL